MRYTIQIFMAFFGSVGFSILFRTEKDKVLKASIGGMIAWGIYLLMGIWTQMEVIRIIMATLVLTFYAEFLAVRERTPVTIFSVSGAIPLIPGGALYQTMTYAVGGNVEMFLKSGENTLLSALAIAAGILIGMSAARVLIHRPKIS